MRELQVDGVAIDAGPTVFTLRGVFEDLFAAAGTSLDHHISLQPASVLARHAWSEDERLDLFADLQQTVDAIAAFSGAADAAGYREFCGRAQRVYRSLETTFIRAQRPGLDTLIAAFGLRRFGELWQISPFVSLWRALGEHFTDPRLRQLFGRYATYCGSSPFLAPATLMLVSHVEREGVWLIEGGMHRLAQALMNVAAAQGATFRFGREVREVTVRAGLASGVVLADGEYLAADAVIVNADVAAVGRGLLGQDIAGTVLACPPKGRSLSAATWAMKAKIAGFPLLRHNVFFSRDYAAEFQSLQAGDLPADPTVYVCAQARSDDAPPPTAGSEPLLCLVNAPARGDFAPLTPSEIAQCETRTFARLKRCGLEIERQSDAMAVTTPNDFEKMFPGTGGALYGPASHGWMASFRRSGARCRIPGLYFAGGSTHPGPGVPMAAISGRLAAEAVLSDLGSTRRSRPAAMSGGTSMR